MPKGVYPHKARTIAEKFSSLRVRLKNMSEPIPECGCYIFTGTVDRLGYGSIAFDKKTRLKAHRASYMAFVGEIPAGLDVLHRCDQRSCIRPDHLWIGTHQDNMNDMNNKGRSRHNKGSKHHNSKLTENEVLYIRSAKKSERKLAEELGVSSATIHTAKKGITWRHV